MLKKWLLEGYSILFNFFCAERHLHFVNKVIMLFRVNTREETDYQFDIILYTHRIFQMFEFPAMDILASKNIKR